MSELTQAEVTAILLDSHASAVIGIFIGVFLYGSQVVQSFTYYDTYHKDPLWAKIFVGFLLLADFFHSLFSAGYVFQLMILKFGDLEAWTYAYWQIRTGPALGGLIHPACQFFFAWRIYVLTKNVFISGFIVLLGLGVLIGGLGIAIRLTWETDMRHQESFKSWVTLWLLPGMIADIAITISMTWFLRRRSNGFRQTDTIINRILRLTFQNCLLTSLFATIDLAMFLATPKGYHIGFSYIVTKLYSNSVLSSLNSRNKLVDLGSDWDGHLSTPSHLRRTPSRTASQSQAHQGVYNLSTVTGPEVYVNVQRSVVTDDTKASDMKA